MIIKHGVIKYNNLKLEVEFRLEEGGYRRTVNLRIQF